MTVYEIPNIEHCNVEPIGNPAIGYRISTHEGWYIRYDTGDEYLANIWKTTICPLANDDFTKVIIVAEADLPEGAEICGGDNDHEVM